ncbi:MAG: hypothetical protein A2042_05315 [Candidatus Schekmanbacteria bacterium GWA2_38_11]|uniref:NodB homology domain-containing protein n=1 Tax=Candidatus Schekmanbacteria bacterium GWA2_38_11 TaxID=1817876 RepID=A0A1F7RGK9_9BACT|nr:MAG: hypothetical protein A2042_05315 [Candidatus Schekmanbacteria bacterium GWA2_38_11]
MRSFLNRNHSGGVKILLYHHIPKNKKELFKNQINYLANNYQFITPVQFRDFIGGRYSFSGIKLLITFDDGFKSNLAVAEEILKPLGIKGIFFIPPDFIELIDNERQKDFISQKIYDGEITNSCITSDMKPLTWQDLEYLLEQGHTIGSHTKTHSRLSNLHSKDELYDEIIESGDLLEKKLGVPIDYFAYPFGNIDSINKPAMELIKQRYRYCFSGIRGINSPSQSSYTILRDTVYIDDPPMYVRLIIEGGIDSLYRRKILRLLELAK